MESKLKKTFNLSEVNSGTGFLWSIIISCTDATLIVVTFAAVVWSRPHHWHLVTSPSLPAQTYEAFRTTSQREVCPMSGTDN